MERTIGSCPFCGNNKPTVRTTEDNGLYWVRCNKCCSDGPRVLGLCGKDWHKKSVDKAIDKWNERSPCASDCHYQVRKIRCFTVLERDTW